jgi:transposase
MFQDEARFGRINDARRCWAPAGVRPEVPAQIVREFTYAFAALSPHDGVLDSLILPEVNADLMAQFLREVAARHPGEFIVMVLDQAGWHRTRNLSLPENIRLEWLPAYSPQCNPVEHLWDEIREKWFGNRVFQDMQGVEDTLESALATLESAPKRVKGIGGFKWIVSIPLIAT